MINVSGALLCVLIAGIGGFIWFTWRPARSQNKQLKLAGMLLLGLVAIILIWLSIPLLSIMFPCLVAECVQIDVNDLPIYPNAQSVVREGPIESDYAEGEIYSWKFSTEDAPDAVWKFYKSELEKQWRFYESGSTDTEKKLLLDSCPFYYLEMKTFPNEDGFHEVTISFIKELCR